MAAFWPNRGMGLKGGRVRVVYPAPPCYPYEETFNDSGAALVVVQKTAFS